MRTLGEIMSPGCKISLFSWNGKFLIKYEQGLCEQIFKFEHSELEETQLRPLASGPLLENALKRFEEMQAVRLGALE